MEATYESLEKKIYILEDDKVLIAEAKKALEPEYKVAEIDVKQTMNINYWKSLNIAERSLLVLDLNLKLEGVNYSGKDVLALLDKEKGRDKTRENKLIPYLNRILVATSVRGEISPRNLSPDIATISDIYVYGLEKAMTLDGKTTDYGQSLRQMIDDIYTAKVNPLNEAFMQRYSKDKKK